MDSVLFSPPFVYSILYKETPDVNLPRISCAGVTPIFLTLKLCFDCPDTEHFFLYADVQACICECKCLRILGTFVCICVCLHVRMCMYEWICILSFVCMCVGREHLCPCTYACRYVCLQPCLQFPITFIEVQMHTCI